MPVLRQGPLRRGRPLAFPPLTAAWLKAMPGQPITPYNP